MRLSPVNSALLLGHHSLQVSELQEAIMEVVEVQDAHQEEAGGDEDPREELSHGEPLQAEALQSGAGGRREERRAKS